MKPEQSVNVPGEPRTWTVEYRRARFLGRKKKLEAANLGAVFSLSEEPEHEVPPTLWHEVPDDNTVIHLPGAHPEEGDRSVDVYVKYHHKARGEVVVSVGHLDFDSGAWIGLHETGDDPHYKEVTAVAWAALTSKLGDWFGPVLK